MGVVQLRWVLFVRGKSKEKSRVCINVIKSPEVGQANDGLLHLRTVGHRQRL